MACASVSETVDLVENAYEQNDLESEQQFMDQKGDKKWEVESYVRQTEHWPSSGSHILAQYDDDSIVVYQAYEPMIAQYAVDNQR